MSDYTKTRERVLWNGPARFYLSYAYYLLYSGCFLGIIGRVQVLTSKA